MSFRRCWARFNRRARALAPTPGVREAWHGGRRWYHVSVLEVTDPAVVARRDAVFAEVERWCHPFSVATPHVTVWVHGFSPPARALDGEVTLRVGRVNAFASCPFLEVRGDIGPVRARCDGVEERWAGYLPHLTVGRFHTPVEVTEVARVLRPFRDLPEIPTTGVLRHMCLDAWSEEGVLVPAGEVYSSGWASSAETLAQSASRSSSSPSQPGGETFPSDAPNAKA